MSTHHNASPLRRIVGGFILLIIVALTIYFATTYTGLYRWLAELQLKWFGSYETQITFILTLFLLLLPFLAIGYIWNKASRAAFPPGPADAPAPSPPPVTPADIVFKRFMGRYGMVLTLGIVAAVFFVQGGNDFYRATRSNQLVQIPAAQLEQGAAIPSSKWIALQGHKLLDLSQAIEESTSSTRHFIPVVSDAWKQGSPVAAFIEVPAGSIDDNLKNALITRHEGMINSTGLPGMVRVAFERDGLTPAASYIVLDYAATPVQSRRAARDILILASILAAGALACLAYQLFKSRPASAFAQPVTAAKTYVIKTVVALGAPQATAAEAPSSDNPPLSP